VAHWAASFLSALEKPPPADFPPAPPSGP
jgi:hypothetical protein